MYLIGYNYVAAGKREVCSQQENGFRRFHKEEMGRAGSLTLGFG